MANSIKLRRSAVQGKQPDDLALGEIAINTFDGIFYFTVIQNGVKYLYRLAGELVGPVFGDAVDFGDLQATSALLDFGLTTQSPARAVDFGSLN